MKVFALTDGYGGVEILHSSCQKISVEEGKTLIMREYHLLTTEDIEMIKGDAFASGYELPRME